MWEVAALPAIAVSMLLAPSSGQKCSPGALFQNHSAEKNALNFAHIVVKEWNEMHQPPLGRQERRFRYDQGINKSCVSESR
jgi:hypothetical protein